PDGTLDTCIAIRTIVLHQGVALLQAGAGIVADSDPAAEHDECLRKLAAIDADEAARLAPSQLVISPGPGRPAEAGATLEIVRRLAPQVPTLGVCLGHQAVIEAFGGEIGPAKQ